MTAVAGGRAASAHAPLPSHEGATGTTVADDRPALADGTLLLGPQQGSGYVEPPCLVQRGDGQVLQLTPLLFAVLEAVDGQRDLTALAERVSGVYGKTLTAGDVQQLVDGKLRQLGLLNRADGTAPEVRKVNPLLTLRPRFVVSKPHTTRRVTRPFSWLFHPVPVVLFTLAFAVVAFWVLFDKGLASAAYQAFTRPGLLLAVFALTIVSAGFHEFGHAAALRRAGGTPGAMGAGLYLIWPAFYTDVTDSYRLTRAQRIRVDLGGLYFNAIVAIATFGLWALVHWDGLLLLIAAQILQMIRQLPPLVRFDGYHLLADIAGVPDLFHRIGPTLRSFGPRRWRVDSPELKPWARAMVTLWVLVVVPLLLLTVLLTVLALPRILGTTWHSVLLQAQALGARAHAGDIPGMLAKALAIVALVVPVGGICFMLVRAGRSYGKRAWQKTSGRPVARGISGVVAAAMLAGLAFAWWPGQNYRPIQSYERGTVQDILPAAVTGGLVAGSQQTATSIWADDGTGLPTASHPVVAIVLRPASGNGPTWVFPFNKPKPPGVGDNQALAVVTKSGGVAYKTSFALVWATGDTALNRNDAYALARCTRCKAVAIAFQVVLVLPTAHIVAPQNLAAAVNYKCLQCVTEAIAQQLVLSVPGLPSAAVQQQLDALWRQIIYFSHHLGNLSFSQIQHRIAAYKKAITALLRPDQLTPTAPATSPSAAATPGGSLATPAAPPPSDSTSTTGGGTSTSGGSSGTGGTATTSTAPAPSASDTASPTASPTP